MKFKSHNNMSSAIILLGTLRVLNGMLIAYPIRAFFFLSAHFCLL